MHEIAWTLDMMSGWTQLRVIVGLLRWRHVPVVAESDLLIDDSIVRQKQTSQAKPKHANSSSGGGGAGRGASGHGKGGPTGTSPVVVA